MSNTNIPRNNNERRPGGISDLQRDRLRLVLGAIGTTMDRVGAAVDRTEVNQKPQTLERYPDGAVVKIHRSPQRLEAKELVDTILDPVADSLPVLIRATGKRHDGTFEQRFLFLGPEAAIAGVLDSEGRATFLKDRSTLLDNGDLDSISPIEIGKAWQSPKAKENLGRVDSVTVPYIHGYSDDWLDQTHEEGVVSPLAIGRDKTDEFKRMRGVV